MMAEKSLSLDDVPKIRHAFASCIEYLAEKTDFNVMYEELNNTDIGKQRMSHVFILKGGQSSQQNSQQLYDGIYKEKDNEFILWFDDIKSSLCRTANKNNGKHQKNLDILLGYTTIETTRFVNHLPVRSRLVYNYGLHSSLVLYISVLGSCQSRTHARIHTRTNTHSRALMQTHTCLTIMCVNH